MSAGHITLDGRLYMLTDLGLYHKGTANQMAHAVGQGQTQYKDLTSWSAWVQADWQGGVGMKDAEGGGFLYAEGADTRFPEQVILGPWVEYTGQVRTAYQNTHAYLTQVAFGDDGEWRFAFYADNPPGDQFAGWWLEAAARADSIVGSRLYEVSGDAPGSTYGAFAIVNRVALLQDKRHAPRWMPLDQTTGGSDRFVGVQSGVSSTVHQAYLDILCAPARRPAYVDAGSGFALWRVALGLSAWQAQRGVFAGVHATVPAASKMFAAADGKLMLIDYNSFDWLTARSDDNGYTWSNVSSGAFNNLANDIDLAGGNGAWCAAGTDGTSNQILRSLNDGLSWNSVYDDTSGPVKAGGPHSILNGGGNTWIAGVYRKLLRSTDNGANWSSAFSLGSTETIADLATDGTNWVAVGVTDAGATRLLRSADDGANWAEVSTSHKKQSVAYADGAWVAATVPVSGSTALIFLRSTDGGATWAEVTVDADTSVSVDTDAVWVRGVDEVWVANGGRSRHYISRDSGATWSVLDTGLALAVFGEEWRQTGQVIKADNHVWMTLHLDGAPQTDWKLMVANEQVEPLHVLRKDGIETANGGAVKLANFRGDLHLANHGTWYWWDEINGVWDDSYSSPNIGSNPVTDVAVPEEDEIWFCFGGSGADIRVYTSGVGFTTKTSTKADLLFIGAGYLWRSVGHTLYYTNDGSTWEGPVVLYPHNYPIRGMAAMEGELYCSTDFGLYHIAPGDVPDFITKWGIVDSGNGAGMIEYNGALYMPVGQDVFEFGPTGGVRPMGLNQREGLPDDRQGRVTALAALNNYLLAGVSASAANGNSSLWAWTGEGWHNLAVFPEGLDVKDLKFEDETANLWVALGDGEWVVPAKIRLPNDLTNPAKDARDDIRFMPAGWLETDWFYAGVRQNDKDWESVTVFGENLGVDRYADVYWQADDDTSWTLLGRAAAETTELVWDDLDTRPTGQRIRLGVLVATQAPLESPIINAVSLKYMTMLHDWFRWTLPIGISGGPVTKQELLDGSVQSYTGDEQLTHLLGLATRVKPIDMVDLDGSSQVVKVLDVQLQASKYAVKSSTREIEWRAMVTVENVRSS